MLAQLVLFLIILASGWSKALAFEPRTILGTALFVVGIAIVGLSFWMLGRSLSPYPEPLAGGRLVDRGPYGLVRHPIYTGVIATFLGFSLRTGSWLALGASVVLVAFFWLKTGREERALRAAYPEYEAYAQRVPRRLIPFLL